MAVAGTIRICAELAVVGVLIGVEVAVGVGVLVGVVVGVGVSVGVVEVTLAWASGVGWAGVGVA